MLIKIALLSLLTFIVNLPFGWLRTKTKKLAVKLLYIHLPIPLIVVIRLTLKIQPIYIPLLIAVAIAGQLVGSRLLPRLARAKT